MDMLRDSNVSTSAAVASLSEDNAALIARVAELQSLTSDLKERVDYLEDTNAGLVADLTKKSFIIHSYAVTGRGDSIPSAGEGMPPGIG